MSQKISRHSIFSKLAFSVTAVLLVMLFAYGILVHQAKFVVAAIFWGGFLALLFLARKNSILHTISFDNTNNLQNILIAFTALATVL